MEFGVRTRPITQSVADDFHVWNFGWKHFIWNVGRQVSVISVSFTCTFLNPIYLTINFRYGRRQPLVAAVFIQLITGLATAFAPWFWLFCVLRFLTALATGGTMVTR